MENFCYVILGMHRSSTSMISKCLHEQGEVFMGKDLLGPGRGNEDGHYEDKRFLDLNDEILSKANGSWDNPPSREAIEGVAKEFSSRIQSLISDSCSNMKEAGYRSWGFKDPRTCLTLPVYLPYLNNPRFIVIKRPLIEVAKSLEKRDGMRIEKGISLAKAYNDRIDSYDILHLE